jgi:hypothetical protein
MKYFSHTGPIIAPPALDGLASSNVIKDMKNNYSYNKISQYSRGHQSGIALVMGLVLLLIITILGIAAIRSTTQQERMAANSQQQTVTFQSAEQVIRQIMEELRGQGVQPDCSAGQSLLVVAIEKWTDPTTATCYVTRTPPTNNASVTATATIAYTGTGIAPGYSAGSYKNYLFTITSTATQTGSNAWDQHLQGISRVGP